MKEKIILIGGGGHCRSCIDVVESLGKYEILGVIDMPDRIGDDVLGYKVIGCDDQIGDFIKPNVHFLITVGQIKSCSLRQSLYGDLRKLGASSPAIISPRARVSPRASVGAGTIVMHDALINTGARVGQNCIINTKALVEHDASVGDHCHVSTGAILNGHVQLGEGTFVGSAAVCVPCVEIQSQSFIKAGSLKC